MFLSATRCEESEIAAWFPHVTCSCRRERARSASIFERIARYVPRTDEGQGAPLRASFASFQANQRIASGREPRIAAIEGQGRERRRFEGAGAGRQAEEAIRNA